MDRRDLFQLAAQWMASRGWRAKLAKRRQYEQTLFEHSLIELDVLLELLPILSRPRHYGLTEDEQKVLAVAVLAHDVGKETDAWQAWIVDSRPERRISHVIPELTRVVVPDLCASLGFSELSQPVQRLMAHCAEFHHARPGRSDGAVMEAMLSGASDRFLTLATLVKAIDHFCSAASAVDAVDAGMHDPALGQHLKITRHEVIVRGVSSTFLHRAARTAFEERGWRTLLYFAAATVYAADPNDRPLEPTRVELQSALKAELGAAIARNVTPLMVGSPTGNILPKPDLLSFAETRQYLMSAAGKIGPQSFARKPLRTRRKVVEEYRKLRGLAGIPTDAQVEEMTGRISVAQPEMLVFKFFKAIVDPEKVAAIGEDGAMVAAKEYEKIFGEGSWASLQSTSTLMPARDMARTVDHFWALPGETVGRPEVGKVAELPENVRLELLIDVLDRIARQTYSAIANPSPRERLSQTMADAFIVDLLTPEATADVATLARAQLEHYRHSKPFAGKESAKAEYLCPICTAAFGLAEGIRASADFIDNPQTHTNRGVSHGSFGYVMVCRTCYYERLLLQILLGDRPKELITLRPRLNFGPERGERLIGEVREWIEAAQRLMRGEEGGVESGFSLGFIDRAAGRLHGRDPFGVDAGELLDLFRFRFNDKTQKDRRREAMKRLREEFDDDLEAVRVAAGRAFPTWEAAVEALVEGGVAQQEFLEIRRQVFRLVETVGLVCQTPNLIFIPLTYEVAAGNDESDTSKALRRLYVAILLSLVFDASVAIHKPGEPVDFRGVAGVAYVPPVPAVRALVRHDWMPVTEAARWLSAVGAASLLAKDTGLPARSALYQTLAADPPERIARRIEGQRAGDRGRRRLTPRHLELIARLPGFHQVREEEEVRR